MPWFIYRHWYKLKIKFLAIKKFLYYHIVLIPKHKKDLRYNGNDEFHHSLDFDGELYMHLNEGERKAYIRNLIHRRNEIHERNL